MPGDPLVLPNAWDPGTAQIVQRLGFPVVATSSAAVANSLGLVLNRGTYAILVTFVELCAAQPIWAVAAGSIAGLGANFFLSRWLVFR